MREGDAGDKGVLLHEAPEGCWAWVGVRLAPASTLSRNRAYPDIPEPARRTEAVESEQAWLAAQWTAHGGTRFEVRYLNDPGTDLVSCVLLGHVYRPDRATAVAAAGALREAMAATPGHVTADPIGEAAEVRRFLVPFAPPPPAGGGGGALVEVRKRLSWAPCSRRDTGRGCCVAISPLARGERSWEPVWAALATLPTRTLVGICAEPCAVNPGLRARIGLLAEEYARLAAEGPASPLWNRAAAPDPFAVVASPLYSEAVRRYVDRAFRIRISIASEREVPATFAELLAATISTATPGAAFAGGLATLRRPQGAEWEAAWRNVTALNRDWLDETYRQGAPEGSLSETERILADLADLEETAAAFRLPYEAPGHVALFRTRDRVARVSGRAVPPPPPARAQPMEDPGAPSFGR